MSKIEFLKTVNIDLRLLHPVWNCIRPSGITMSEAPWGKLF